MKNYLLMLAVVATYVSAEPQFPFGLTPGFPLPLIYNSPPVYYHKVEGGQEKGLEKTPDFYHKVEGEELKERSLEKAVCRNNEGSLVPCAHAAVEPSHEVGVTPRPLLPYLAVDWTGVSCGGHHEATCRYCHSTNKHWCNGDCHWKHNECTYKTTGGFAKEVLAATNKHRRSNGKSELTLDSKLTASAQEWARKLANTCEFEHRPHNQWPSHAGAENLAGSCEWYPQGITPVFDNWKNSPGHNVNMLGDHKVMGVGLGQKKGCEKFCWTSGNQADQEGSVIVAMYG